MAEGQSRKTLEFWISNKTRSPLTYHRFDREFHSSPYLNLELPPGLSDCCQIFSDPDSPGIEKLLVYEAESFTLAVFVNLCPRRPKTLRLELSLDKVHLSDLDQTFSRMGRMVDPPDPRTTDGTVCEFPAQGKVSTGLLIGTYKVTATLSHYKKARLLRVQLEKRATRVVRARNDPCVIL